MREYFVRHLNLMTLTIERDFGTAKEHHAMRYTQQIGKEKMAMKVGLTFACMLCSDIRSLYPSNAPDRPQSDDSLPYDRALFHAADDPAVLAVVPVVAHDKNFTLRNRPRLQLALAHRSVFDIGLGGFCIIDICGLAVCGDGVAGQADHALDPKFMAFLTAVEDDDISAGGLAEFVGQLAYDQVIAVVQGVVHGLPADECRLDAGGDDQHQHQRDGEVLDQIFQKSLNRFFFCRFGCVVRSHLTTIIQGNVNDGVGC